MSSTIQNVPGAGASSAYVIPRRQHQLGRWLTTHLQLLYFVDSLDCCQTPFKEHFLDRQEYSLCFTCLTAIVSAQCCHSNNSAYLPGAASTSGNRSIDLKTSSPTMVLLLHGPMGNQSNNSLRTDRSSRFVGFRFPKAKRPWPTQATTPLQKGTPRAFPGFQGLTFVYK